jgi:hypothetical protein
MLDYVLLSAVDCAEPIRPGAPYLGDQVRQLTSLGLVGMPEMMNSEWRVAEVISLDIMKTPVRNH